MLCANVRPSDGVLGFLLNKSYTFKNICDVINPALLFNIQHVCSLIGENSTGIVMCLIVAQLSST